MNRTFVYILVFFLANASVFSQSKLNQFFKPSDTLNVSRRNAVVISEAALATTTLVGLNQLWYADYPRSNFKTLNDSGEWLQMDKLGHAFSSYQLGRLGANTLNWAGVSKKEQLLYGSTLGLGFLTAVEIMDGFSEEWGFSWSDMAANAAGTGLHIGQELLWEDQRIVLKYSFHRTQFAKQRPNKLGSGLAEEFLKDYNGQTYWLSANINSFLKTETIPNWLNVAFGYGADGMLTGEASDPLFLNQNRERQYYLSLDVDLTRIKTNSHFLKTLFDVFNVIKLPFPAVELNSSGRIKWHSVYF
ncbi:YfiM family protein [Winogradskyella pacifica]|uniref:YfiM family protein n=1 Tax=Winogradskyella pacifica TaxID=664642 RepID=UPI00211C8F58|nr:YfiM family protein [Winogradskyella pacifica]